MAIAANSTFEVRTAGNDTNGGGFVTGAAGVDYSQQDAKNTVGNNISTTDAVAVGTGVITSATATFTSDIVGNIIYLQGGTGALAAGWYQVTVFTSSTSITVDRNVAAGTGITMNIGGALASPGGAGAVTLVSENTIWIKAGTYTIASATINIATGCLSKALVLRVEGYNATRGDLGTPPLLQASGISNFTLMNITSNSYVANINFDGASLTTSRGLTVRGWVYKCSVVNCLTTSFNQNTVATFINCIASGNTGTAFNGTNFYDCVAHSNAGTGFSISVGGNASRCLSYSNTGASGNGFNSPSGDGTILTNCVAYDNAQAGFVLNLNTTNFINCIAESNAGAGFSAGAGDACGLYNCAAFDNGTDFNLGADNLTVNIDSIIGTGSFFTNAAAGDFSLNNNSGGGAELRAAGIPGVFPGGLTTGFLDIGAAQHQDSGGGGGEVSSVF